MAYLMRVFCCGCPFICPAASLSVEYLSRLVHENRDVFEEIVYLRSVYVYCPRDITYKLFKFSEERGQDDKKKKE